MRDGDGDLGQQRHSLNAARCESGKECQKNAIKAFICQPWDAVFQFFQPLPGYGVRSDGRVPTDQIAILPDSVWGARTVRSFGFGALYDGLA